MPKSKRSKVVSLTKVDKKNRAHKEAQITLVRPIAPFKIANLINVHTRSKKMPTSGSTVGSLKFALSAMDTCRPLESYGKGMLHMPITFAGKTIITAMTLLAKALGTTPEEEHRMGIHKLAQQIQGEVGLLFTDSEPQEVIEWFADFHPPDFARSGNVATRTVVLPAGPVMQHHSDPPEPFPHNEEPQLRKLGLSTRMNKGVPTIDVPHKICEKGKTLTSEQAQLLKLVGEKMVEFKVGLLARWDAATGEVTTLETRSPKEQSSAEETGSDDEDAEMDE
ncbi:mRNA turnover and ribosome assembly protein [Marasmius tenuissimus]|uniref:Ribosome assembly factor mrt4 n=1 Tax=Marasmius tenuissimus TaxID=585030 RepID=A0ABR3A8Z6_9AGAR